VGFTEFKSPLAATSVGSRVQLVQMLGATRLVLRDQLESAGHRTSMAGP
jgi:hypothetical protein